MLSKSAFTLAAAQSLITLGSCFSFYGYGPAAFDATPVYYGDGRAYIGTGTPSGVETITSLDFTTVDSNVPENTYSWIASSTDSSVTFDEPLYFSANVTDGAFQPILFVAADSIPTGYTIDGFDEYYNILWFDSAGAAEGSIWAKVTSDTDVWEIYWAAPNAVVDYTTVVSITVKPPV